MSADGGYTLRAYAPGDEAAILAHAARFADVAEVRLFGHGDDFKFVPRMRSAASEIDSTIWP